MRTPQQKLLECFDLLKENEGSYLTVTTWVRRPSAKQLMRVKDEKITYNIVDQRMSKLKNYYGTFFTPDLHLIMSEEEKQEFDDVMLRFNFYMREIRDNIPLNKIVFGENYCDTARAFFGFDSSDKSFISDDMINAPLNISAALAIAQCNICKTEQITEQRKRYAFLGLVSVLCELLNKRKGYDEFIGNKKYQLDYAKIKANIYPELKKLKDKMPDCWGING